MFDVCVLGDIKHYREQMRTFCGEFVRSKQVIVFIVRDLEMDQAICEGNRILVMALVLGFNAAARLIQLPLSLIEMFYSLLID